MSARVKDCGHRAGNNLVLEIAKARPDRFTVTDESPLQRVEFPEQLRTSVPTIVLVFRLLALVLALVPFLVAVLPALACRLAHSRCIGWLVRQLDGFRQFAGSN